MNIKKQVELFMHHSPGFYEDLELSAIDNKHSNILKNAYQQIRSGKAFSLSNYRSWEGQSDLATPLQISFRAIQQHGLVSILYRYSVAKLFRPLREKYLLSALLDDIEIVKLLGGEGLLLENPVHLTPGAANFYEIGEITVNLRWLRYIYVLKRILDRNLLRNGEVWVDVGSFYGGLQGLVRKYCPESKLVLVDFHHQLCRSFIYLSEQFPDVKHVMPDELSGYDCLEDLPNGAIMYVPVSEYEHIANQSVDLVTNLFSLGEMRREFFKSYMNSSIFRKSKKVFLVNRVVSSPFFEKTYDSDVSILDYISTERAVDYFDLFPMHHYLLIKRKLYGRKSFRNVSSPYFELLTSRTE